VARVWVEGVMSRLTPLAADGAKLCAHCGEMPANRASDYCEACL